MIVTPTGEVVRAFRAYLAWSQSELAEAIPVSRRTLQRYEYGEVEGPKSKLVTLRLQALMRERGFTPPVPLSRAG